MSAAADRDDLLAPEKAALLFVALPELVLNGHEAAWEALVLHGDSAPDGLRAAVEVAQAYWSVARRPLPLDRIQTQLASTRREQEREEAWAQLRASFDKARQTTFRFDSGRKTHEYLFRPKGRFGSLAPVLDARDAIGVQAWLRDPALQSVGKLVDAATAEVTPGLALIEGSKRTSYLARLTAAVTAARAVSDSDLPAEPEFEIPILGNARAVARVLAELWPKLERDAAEIGGPECWLAIVALAGLGVVREWGTE
jgi:hypothetical protein